MRFAGLDLNKNILLSEGSTSDTGAEGEKAAADFLRRKGYVLVASNFKVPVGRNSRGAQVTGEIDLIALDDEILCFIEVKTRLAPAFSDPLKAVDLRKQRQVTRTALGYRRIFGLEKLAYRFDVVGVKIHPSGKGSIQLRKGYWTPDKFKKRRWSV